jgi:hypothetical protein
MYSAVPEVTTGREKYLPTPELNVRRENVRPSATRRFARMVKKLK